MAKIIFIRLFLFFRESKKLLLQMIRLVQMTYKKLFFTSNLDWHCKKKKFIDQISSICSYLSEGSRIINKTGNILLYVSKLNQL